MSFRILALLSTATLPAQDVWTEPDIMRRFLDQNPVERESRARVAASDAEMHGRTLYANPVVSVSREGAGRTEFYQASQALPLSGRFPYLRQAGALQAQSLAADGAFSLWQARCALRAAFYRMVAAQQRMTVLDAGAQDLAEVIRILHERELAGEGSKLDRLRAERERTELHAERSSLDAGLALDRGELLAFLPLNTAVETVSGDLNVRLAPATFDVTQRPDLTAERTRTARYRAEQHAAERLRIPEPVVFAGLKRADLGLPHLATGPVLGVSLTLPVFQKGKTEAARFSAEQERSAARLDLLTRRAQAAVAAAARVLRIRHEASTRYATELTSDDLVRMATVAYQEGEIGILQLLDAYRLRLQSRLRQVDLQSAAKQAQIALEAVSGQELPQ